MLTRIGRRVGLELGEQDGSGRSKGPDAGKSQRHVPVARNWAKGSCRSRIKSGMTLAVIRDSGKSRKTGRPVQAPGLSMVAL